MRDIRTDLQERLDGIGNEREELQLRISDLDTIEAAINALMKREGETFVAVPSAPVEHDFGSFDAKDGRVAVKTVHWDELARKT